MTTRRKSLAAVFSSFSSDRASVSGPSAVGTSNPLASHVAIAATDEKVSKKPFGQVQFSELLNAAGNSKPPIVSVPPDTTLEALLSLLNSQKIFTIPIQSRSRRGRFIAIISTEDILHRILQKTGKTLDRETAQQVLNDKVENLLSLDPDDESYRIWERDYRDTIERTVIAFAQGTHRALITDALAAQPPAILTQTDLILHAMACYDTVKFSADLRAPLTVSLRECIRPVVTMGVSETALTGFLRLQEKKVGALAIVEESRRLVGTLSRSDLRELTIDLFMDMALPVFEFLRQSAEKKPQVFCVPSDTLKDLMERMIENRVHRLWIVDDESTMSVIGVVSQSDILAALLGVPQLF